MTNGSLAGAADEVQLLKHLVAITALQCYEYYAIPYVALTALRRCFSSAAAMMNTVSSTAPSSPFAGGNEAKLLAAGDTGLA